MRYSLIVMMLLCGLNAGYSADILRYANRGDVEGIKTTLQNGDSIDKRDASGDTPLILAAYKGYLEAVRFLVEHGASLEAKNYDGGNTPLIVAARYDKADVVTYLISKRAKLEAKNKNGRTALIEACYRGKLNALQALARGGADLNVREPKYKRTMLIWASQNGKAGVAKALLEAGADTEKTDPKYNRTALIWASRAGHIDIVRELIKHKAMINHQDSNAMDTPLILAANTGKGDVINALLAAGAGINLTNKYGRTALYYAARGGHLDSVRTLVNANADITIADKWRATAWGIAAQGEQTAICDYFMKRYNVPKPDWECLKGKIPARAYIGGYRSGIHLHLWWMKSKREGVKIRHFKTAAGANWPAQRIHSVEAIDAYGSVTRDTNNIHYLEYTSAVNLPTDRSLAIGFVAEIDQYLKSYAVHDKLNLRANVEIPNDIKRYLLETEQYNYTAANMAKVIRDLTRDNPDYITRIRRVWDYVDKTFSYKTCPRPNTASQLLAWKHGTCSEFTRLSVALWRGCGIPARGLWSIDAQVNPSESDHKWPEVYVPGIGWLSSHSQFALPKTFQYRFSFRGFYVLQRFSVDDDNVRSRSFSGLCSAADIEVSGPNGYGIFIELPANERGNVSKLIKHIVRDDGTGAEKLYSQVESAHINAKPALYLLLCASVNDGVGKKAAEMLLKTCKADAKLDIDLYARALPAEGRERLRAAGYVARGR